MTPPKLSRPTTLKSRSRAHIYLFTGTGIYIATCVSFKWWHRRYNMAWEPEEGYQHYDPAFRAAEDERWGINREATKPTWLSDESRVHGEEDARLPMSEVNEEIERTKWTTRLKNYIWF